jgi:membrane protease YdiL (CAAX protease family)
MKSASSTWLGLALALLGPGLIALLSTKLTASPISLSASIFWLSVFGVLVATVATIAFYGEKLDWRDIGFGRVSWSSLPSAIGLALFFILIFGPAAAWVLAKTGAGSFDIGRSAVATLPAWYLGLTVVVVAAGEEWLYRGYAIERLEALTGNAWIAGGISLFMFAIVHLPLWGFAVSLTTLVSGGILTGVYIWRRDVSSLILAHVLTDFYGLVIAPMSPA